ncbi:MAG: hypothetical protein C0621_00685 [Desulfuromonas sp.]|nr:MAG: hypothetical protein C0621_00685 [Desulfuromonas sp.]
MLYSERISNGCLNLGVIAVLGCFFLNAKSERRAWLRQSLSVFVSLLFSCAATPVFAETVELPVVHVYGERPLAEPVPLSRSDLDALPVAEGGFSEALRYFPGVQLSDTTRGGDAGGEIAPVDFVISGGRLEENRISFDGVSIDNRLDPASRNPNLLNDLAGQTVDVLPNLHLVDEIILYDHNIPARYGNFTGGVVEIQSRLPATEAGGVVYLRTTGDRWNKEQVSDGDTDDFVISTDPKRGEPRYTIYDAGIDLDLPLSRHWRSLLSWQTLQSRLPFHHLGGTKVQHRRTDNLFGKLLWEPSWKRRLEFSLLYTPVREARFVAESLDSDYRLRRDGLLLSSTYQHSFAQTEWEVRLALRRSENSRQAPRDWYNWQVTPSRDWGTLSQLSEPYSREGGFGDLQKKQTGISIGSDLEAHPRPLTEAIRHQPAVGIELEQLQGLFVRPEPSTVYTIASACDPEDPDDPDCKVRCADDDPACVDDEQYFDTRSLHLAGRARVHLTRWAIYGEERFCLGDWEFRPGLRLTRDDYMRNSTLAPRFALRWKILPQERLLLTFGVNRYYGQALLTNKLREALQYQKIEKRTLDENGAPLPWETSVSTEVVTRYGQLRTPYNDELAIGLHGRLGSVPLSLDYVAREGHDEFAREKGDVQPDGTQIYTLNNRGRSHYQSVTLSGDWQGRFLAVRAVLGWQQSRNNAEDYDTLLDAGIEREPVWYKGAEVQRDELPRSSYNHAFKGDLLLQGLLGCGWSWSSDLRYRSGYEVVGRTTSDPKTETLPDGTILDIYEAQKLPAYWLVDGKLLWRRPVSLGKEVQFSIELLNLLNQRVATDTDEDTFLPGRRLWLGAEYRF